MENYQLTTTPDGAPWWFEPSPDSTRSNIRGLINEVMTAKELDMTEEQYELLALLLQDMLVREPGERLSSLEVLHCLDSAANLFSSDVAEKVEKSSHGSEDPDAPPPPPPPEPYSDSDSE